jgi:hypothetical protein
MSSQKRAVVRHTEIAHRDRSESLTDLDARCASGARCQDVQASPMAVLALEDLRASVVVAHACLGAGRNALTNDRANTRAVAASVTATAAALRVYERAVDDLADGDPAIITNAGLISRLLYTPRSALGEMTKVTGKPGAHEAEAILSWKAVKGATAYAVEVCFTSDSLDGPSWTALANSNRRTRVIKAPAPGAQILARVAPVRGDGTQSAWSAPILVTAR